jgi:hypothetical protein
MRVAILGSLSVTGWAILALDHARRSGLDYLVDVAASACAPPDRKLAATINQTDQP